MMFLCAGVSSGVCDLVAESVPYRPGLGLILFIEFIGARLSLCFCLFADLSLLAAAAVFVLSISVSLSLSLRLASRRAV